MKVKEKLIIKPHSDEILEKSSSRCVFFNVSIQLWQKKKRFDSVNQLRLSHFASFLQQICPAGCSRGSTVFIGAGRAANGARRLSEVR